MKSEYDAEITEFTKDTLRWRTTSGNFAAISNGTLSPTKAGTEFAIAIDYELPTRFSAKLLTNCGFTKPWRRTLRKV